MIESTLSHPYSGILLSIAAYGFGVWVKSKTKSPLANPLLIATVLTAAAIHYSPLSLEQYRRGGGMITMFIAPATIVLAVQINRQWAILRANLTPVLIGCVAGCLASMASIWLLCRFFGISGQVTTSLIPKSVTTAISIELSEKTGGIPALTVSAVILTGMMSTIFSPFMISLLRLDNRIATGVALGVSGHAIGTAKALEIGETEGALSGIALGVSGVATSLIYALGAFSL